VCRFVDPDHSSGVETVFCHTRQKDRPGRVCHCNRGGVVDRIDVGSTDELGDLARHMEAMSAAIRQQQAEIRNANAELEQRVKERTRELETALSEIKTLKGILPICSHCKKIRDDDGYWNQLEAYISAHSEAQISHGICRECAEKYYPELNLYDEDI
jgi:hypothetical protein